MTLKEIKTVELLIYLFSKFSIKGLACYLTTIHHAYACVTVL